MWRRHAAEVSSVRISAAKVVVVLRGAPPCSKACYKPVLRVMFWECCRCYGTIANVASHAASGNHMCREGEERARELWDVLSRRHTRVIMHKGSPHCKGWSSLRQAGMRDVVRIEHPPALTCNAAKGHTPLSIVPKHDMRRRKR